MNLVLCNLNRDRFPTESLSIPYFEIRSKETLWRIWQAYKSPWGWYLRVNFERNSMSNNNAEYIENDGIKEMDISTISTMDAKEVDYRNYTAPLPKHPNVFQKMIYQIDKEFFEEYGITFAVEKYIRYIDFEDLFDTELIVLASQVAAAGFRHRTDTLWFMHSQWLNSKNLKDSIYNGTFKPKFYRKRNITERGKAREIKPPHFECKTVQKVGCNVLLRPTLEHRMIYHNNGSATCRGTDKTYYDVLKHLNQALKVYGKDGVIVITDFTGYFASIDREGILHDNYRKIFRDPRIADFLIMFDDGEVGLTLGNETSQIPASAFAGPIDHYFKDRLRLKFYDRYMDDTEAILKDMDDADRYIRLYKKQADKLGLSLVKQKDGRKKEKIQKIQLGQSFTFCKEQYIYSKKDGHYYMLPNAERVRNIKHKIKAYRNHILDGKMTEEEAITLLNAMVKSFIIQPNTRKMMEEIKETALNNGFRLAI